MKESEEDEIITLLRWAGSLVKDAVDELVEIAGAALRIAIREEFSKEDLRRTDRERRFVSTEELAKRLGIAPITVHRLRKQGLPQIRIGHRGVFDHHQVTQWIDQRNRELKKG